MNKNLFFFFCALLLCNCQSPKVDVKAHLKHLEQTVLRSWPNQTTDSLFLPNKDVLAEQLAQAYSWENSLKILQEEQLTIQQLQLKDSLLQICTQTVDQLSIQQIHRWQATLYDVGPTLLNIYNHKPETLIPSLNKVPEYYKIARQNLDSVNLDEINQSIRFNIATFRWLKQLEQQSQYEAPAYQARIAIKDYLAWCNSLVFEYYDAQVE